MPHVSHWGQRRTFKRQALWRVRQKKTVPYRADWRSVLV